MRVKHGNLSVHWPMFMQMLPITLIKQLAFLIPQFSMGVIMGSAQAFRSTGQLALFALKNAISEEEKTRKGGGKGLGCGTVKHGKCSGYQK